MSYNRQILNAGLFNGLWNDPSKINQGAYVKPKYYLKVGDDRALCQETSKNKASSFSEIVGFVGEIIKNKDRYDIQQLKDIKSSFKQIRINYDEKYKSTLIGRILRCIYQKLGWWQVDQAEERIQTLENVIASKQQRRIISTLDEQPGKFVAQHLRTQLMHEVWKRSDCYDEREGTLAVGSLSYRTIYTNLTNISTTRVASLGCSAGREVLVLDPDNSPTLCARYELLIKALQMAKEKSQRELREGEVLNVVKFFVRQVIFPNSESRKVSAFVDEKMKDPKFEKIDIQGECTVAIPIDQFIEARIGVCRHHALVTSYILDRLTKDGWLDGQVQHIRDNVPGGAHAWVTYMSTKGHRWHIDTLWGHVVDFKSKTGQQELVDLGYGEEAVKAQLKKTQPVFEEVRSLQKKAATLSPNNNINLKLHLEFAKRGMH